MQVTALASGSSGNAYLVRAGDTAVLLDAGVPAAALERYVRAQGVAPAALAAIFVSHEHVDHVRGAGMLARRYRIPVVANAATLRAAAASLGTLPEALTLAAGQECRLGSLTVRTFPVPHDAADTVGFRVEAEGCCVCVCTDLGEPPPGLTEELDAADLLVLEANHDLDRLWRGPYPPALKRRVGGPRGHLSNGAAARLARTLAETGRPRAIWLAHLSAVNNAPALAHAAVAGHLARDAADHCTVAVAARDRPSLIWHSPPVGPAAPPRPRPAPAAAPASERALAQLELPF